MLEKVLILTIEKRKDFQVFKIADKRLNELKALPKKDIQETVKKTLDVFGGLEFIQKKKN